MDSTAVSALATVVLVGITGYYAAVTHMMVREMRNATRNAQRPHINGDLWFLGGMHPYAEIRNVGPGAAINANLVVTWEPLQGGDAKPYEVTWRGSITPGHHHVLQSPTHDSTGGHPMDVLTSKYASMRITGTVEDSLGNEHDVASGIRDLGAYWNALGMAGERIRNQTISLESVVDSLDGIAKAVETTAKT